jgi:hypothetical protein
MKSAALIRERARSELVGIICAFGKCGSFLTLNLLFVVLSMRSFPGGAANFTASCAVFDNFINLKEISVFTF